MTLTQRALFQTSKFVIGTVVLGTIMAVFYLNYPEVAAVMALTGLFAFLARTYYTISLAQLQREAQEIQRVLRG
jgi:hypothetical protein